MTVYLINIALILFWRLFFAWKQSPNAGKFYCGIVALQWILISGLRSWKIGADTVQYFNRFEAIKQTAWGRILRNLFAYLFRGGNGKDPGYDLITKVFQLFSKNYQVFLLAVAVCFMTLMAIWIYENSSSPCTSYILFSTLFYEFYALTGHRQTIATALVVFLGYELMKQKRFWEFVPVALAAFLIHKSSLVFVPVYFLLQIPVTVGYMILCGSVIALVAVLGKDLYGLIAFWLGFDAHMIEYSGGGAELYATMLVLLCLVFWLLYPRIRCRGEDASMLFHINALALLSGLLVFQNQSFMRIQQYFSLFHMITIPEVLNTVKREYRLLVYLLFGAFMIAYLIGKNPQYQFCFMD